MPDEALTNSVSQPPAGFYGKVPIAGDFVSRDLPRSFIDAWDRWLQSVIHASQSALGREWLDLYLTSPIWRFVLSPGLCGQQAWLGVIIPSVDRVGRYFPFTLACQAPTNADLLALLADNDDWFRAAEELALTSLDDGFDLEDLRSRLAGLPGPTWINSPPQSEPDTETDCLAWRCALPNSSLLNKDRLRTLGTQLLREFLFTYSLWWSAGSDRLEASLLVNQGLPSIDRYAAMLGGDWSQYGWHLRNLGGSS